MRPDEVIRPFRWDVRRRSQLGSLPAIDVPNAYPEFEEDLIVCSARVLAFAGDSDLVFVGRSPQPLFDLLSGLLTETSWQDRLRLLNVSLRHVDPPDQEQLRAIRPYLAEVGLEPHALTRRRRPLALVDVVDTGDTFGALLQFVKEWSDEARVEWRAVARKIRIVGLTWRERTSPKTRRWHQHAEWVERLRPSEIKNVSLPPDLRRTLPLRRRKQVMRSLRVDGATRTSRSRRGNTRRARASPSRCGCSISGGREGPSDVSRGRSDANPRSRKGRSAH
jgi:hypothetical protein